MKVALGLTHREQRSSRLLRPSEHINYRFLNWIKNLKVSLETSHNHKLEKNKLDLCRFTSHQVFGFSIAIRQGSSIQILFYWDNKSIISTIKNFFSPALFPSEKMFHINKQLLSPPSSLASPPNLLCPQVKGNCWHMHADCRVSTY